MRTGQAASKYNKRLTDTVEKMSVVVSIKYK